MYLMNILIINNRVRTPFRFSHSLFFSLSFFFIFFSRTYTIVIRSFSLVYII